MGIIGLLIHLEAMGCFDVCRDGQSIAYCLDERGKTQKQISRLERKVQRVMEMHKPVLMRFLRHMPLVQSFDIVI